ncbi:MAG TPA: peptidase S10 [Candidatus Angelobacter sp.]|jgi:carboxypeptidase C (cathepsin A)
MMFTRVALALFVLASYGFAVAQTAALPQAQAAVSATPSQHDDETLAETPAVVTHHQITVSGKALKYTATAGRLAIKPENGPVEAAIFFTAYTLEGEEPRTRPLTFVFNGGPGTATAWLHMGALGPKKIKLEPDGGVPAPPYVTVENPETILDRTDLVFIDAPGTGYSRVRADLTRKYYNVPGDADAFYKFIRLYLSRYQRWRSPLFLFGESYGTTRAAALANHLIDNYIPVNGVALLSVGLDFQTLLPGNMNDLPYQVIVPSYTMIAAYHKKLAPELTGNLDETIKKVEQWCAGDYAQALAQGNALDPEKRKQIVSQLAAYTGLKPELIEEYDLRVGPQVFMHNLLKDRKLEVGRVDGRVASPLPQSNANEPFFDPAMAAMFPAFNAAMNDYAQTELGYKSELPYVMWNYEGINRAWDWGTAMNSSAGLGGYPQTATNLQSAMAKNKYLKVLVMEGMYDLATPFYASAYTFQHINLNADYRRNITFVDFKGGHMVYNDAAALKEMKRAIDAWYQDALKPAK